MLDSELFLEYKRRCKVGDGHFCILNLFSESGFCLSPFNTLNGTDGVVKCSGRLCSYYKELSYDMSTFIDCFTLAWMLRKEEFEKVYKDIHAKLKGIMEEDREARRKEWDSIIS